VPSKAQRIVVKVGTNTLCGDLDHPDPWYMAALADDLTELRAEGHHVILVTSGAIGAGRSILALPEKPREVRLRQACAAVGQARLMEQWASAFARRGVHVGQVLLTYHTFAARASYLNMREAMLKLLDMGIVPVVNENDTTSIAEIDSSFGDNDRLSALVATKLEADLLLILSDVAGLYTKPPTKPGAELVPQVDEIDDEVMAMAAAKPGARGRGGMRSKLEAARLAMENGTPVVIAPGREPHVLKRVVRGERIGTLFVPRSRKAGARRWLLVARPVGEVVVDAGAARALRTGKHLLPAGVLDVHGHFDVESVVDVVTDGRVIARAISELSSNDLARVRGMQSADARTALNVEAAVNVTKKGNILLLDEK
jgi:glutamate 5-kinase